MNADKLVIIVTGAVGSGKSALLDRLVHFAEKWWRACGFVSFGGLRAHGTGDPAGSYSLSIVGRLQRLPWAQRRADGSGFDFREATRLEAIEAVGSCLQDGTADICFLDEIGQLELRGHGFADLFSMALASPCKVVVASVKKSRLAEVVGRFGITEHVVIDLDRADARRAYRQAKRRIAATDAERIGAFAGIGGVVEVGLGSTLHAYRVPFKGHALAYLQNVLLIAFGKALGGRGLIRISFISAMLKAFSPAGNRFRPMAYIFLQGLSFAVPIGVFGWNIGSVLVGSVAMSWLTLALSLAVDYVTFGKSIFDAFGGAIRAASGWLGMQGPSLLQVLIAAFVLKAVLSVVLGAGAFFGDVQPLVRRLGARRAGRGDRHLAHEQKRSARNSAGATAAGALRDLCQPRFVIAFLASALLLLFFTDLARSDFLSLLLRGLCISYLGFVAMRRIDVRSLGAWLDRRVGLGLGRSLPAALDMLGREASCPAVARPSSPRSRASTSYRNDDGGELALPAGSPGRTP